VSVVVPPCFHRDVVKHEAADDATVDPIVEAAKQRRARTTHGAHRAELPGEQGPIGWPSADHDDAGADPIGWPGELTETDREASEV
jgi:hypothetical protein